MLWIDIETRSKCDLKRAGIYNYSRDKSTEILCIAYAFDDEAVRLWKPGLKLPTQLLQHKGQIRAHNAAFERLVLGAHGFPYKAEQFYCTAAQARANCFPGSLEDVARFAGTDMRKDHRGAMLVRKLCVPDEAGVFNEDPLLMAELYQYCRQDVRTMREASQVMRELSDKELAEYHTNERINDRGLMLDADLARAAVQYAAAELDEVQALAREITNGQVLTLRSPKLREWVWRNTGGTAHDLMMKDGKVSLDKTVRRNLLALAEENNNEVPPDVADVIQCADDIWASSTAKFQRALGLADLSDNRVRGVHVFAGGAATGRASSFGLQTQNFPRKVVKDPEACRAAMLRGDKIAPEFAPSVSQALKGMLRASLIAAPGNVLVTADWSSIEARVSPWAANSATGERKLDVFRSGLDVYKDNATRMFGVPYDEVTDDLRQRSKITELACGFGGGVGAFAVMARAYGMNLPEAEAQRLVNAWRRANPWAVTYWSEMEAAYLRAMRNPGNAFASGRSQYLFDGVHLWLALPSGRVLRYPFARMDSDGVSYAKCSWKPAAGAKEWPRARLWKGLAVQTVTQAVAADILRNALDKLEHLGTCLHVHDEVVVECRATDAGRVEAEMRRVMCEPPEWAEGLPLAVEAKQSTKWGK